MSVEEKNKAFKFRMYPNKEQEEFFAKNFGCARFIYNRMLQDKIEHYKATGQMLKTTPAQYKGAFPWLKEVDSLALSNAQINLQRAFSNFFRDSKVGFPKFKSKKKGTQSYTTNNQKGTVAISDGRHIKLPKIGPVRIKMHRAIPDGHTIKSATVSRTPSGKYYVSVLTVYEADIVELPVREDHVIGLDYSSPHFYVDSNGMTGDMPHFLRKTQEKLAREQKKLSKMVPGSGNYRKQQKRVALVHEKIRNQRNDWIQKESLRLAEAQDAVCVEDLNMQEMGQVTHLGKATADNSFGMFRDILSYKLADRGKKLITISKWFPSSKTCRHCGYIKQDLTLDERTWKCPSCGRILQRDENAAINIKTEGLRMLLA